jgi:hypothetical protein
MGKKNKPPAPPDPRFYTLEETADRCRCGERAVLRMHERGDLVGQPHGKSWRFWKDEVESFVERCERTGSWPDDRR